MPVARSFHTATVVSGKIYVLGGLREAPDDDDNHAFVTTDRVDVYDPAADSWQHMATMPTGRYSHAAAVLDGKIYVTGGISATPEFMDALEVYDPAADTWTTLASLSQSRVCHASAVVKGKLYVIGGEFLDCASTSTNQMEVYSPASNSWARGADVPVAIDRSAAVAL